MALLVRDRWERVQSAGLCRGRPTLPASSGGCLRPPGTPAAPNSLRRATLHAEHYYEPWMSATKCVGSRELNGTRAHASSR